MRFTYFFLLPLFSLLAVPYPDFPPPARPLSPDQDSSSSHIYTQFSFLYWEALEEGLDYGLKNRQSQAHSNLTVLKPSFDFAPAFSIVLGAHFPRRNWDLDFTYSFYLNSAEGQAKGSTSAFGEGILAVWTSPGAFLGENIYARFQHAGSKWTLHRECFDLLLHATVKNSRALLFQPAFGLKMAWLWQRYDVFYSSGNTVVTEASLPERILSSSIDMHNRSFNLGPEVKMTTRWSLSYHWKFFASLSGSLLAAHFDVVRKEQDRSETTDLLTNTYFFQDKFWSYRPEAALSLGFQWLDRLSERSRMRYAIRASYDAEVWWKQNMLLRHIDAATPESPNLQSSQGDLYFQGLTLDLLFDF